ncbi:hypothetical protein BDZ89DRAFT_1061905 [Hymenopellis radicata]|nr:hypothetical protein BDZ89DRAFT_1061905 [Hymenopellis radicata]
MAFKYLSLFVLLAAASVSVNAAVVTSRDNEPQVCPWGSVLDTDSCKCKQTGGNWGFVDFTWGCGATWRDGWCQTWCKPTPSSSASHKQKRSFPKPSGTWKEKRHDGPRPSGTWKEKRHDGPRPSGTWKEKRHDGPRPSGTWKEKRHDGPRPSGTWKEKRHDGPRPSGTWKEKRHDGPKPSGTWKEKRHDGPKPSGTWKEKRHDGPKPSGTWKEKRHDGPIPSGTWKDKRSHDGPQPSGTWKEKRTQPSSVHTRSEKRKVSQLALDDDDYEPLCAGGLDMCPLNDFGYECVSFRHDAENCGACGNACEADEGVKGAVCRKGRCEVYSCKPGYKLYNNVCM